MRKIILTLDENQMTALETLAEKEFRPAHWQAELIIHKELERQGLITVPDPPAPTLPAADQATPIKNADQDG